MHKDDPLAAAIIAACTAPNAQPSVVLYDNTWTHPRVFRLKAWTVNGDQLDTSWCDAGAELAELRELTQWPTGRRHRVDTRSIQISPDPMSTP